MKEIQKESKLTDLVCFKFSNSISTQNKNKNQTDAFTHQVPLPLTNAEKLFQTA